MECNEKRQERIKQTAEVFTPPFLARKMLSKLPKEVWHKGKTFLDPACGTGNLLVPVLWRKLERNHKPLEALQSIYGVDIMRDNIQECRLRLLKLVSIYEPLTEEHIKAVWTNIAWINTEKHKDGSLDYDFSFKPKFKQSDIDRWMEWVRTGRINEAVLPVEETSVPSQFNDIFSEN